MDNSNKSNYETFCCNRPVLSPFIEDTRILLGLSGEEFINIFSCAVTMKYPMLENFFGGILESSVCFYNYFYSNRSYMKDIIISPECFKDENGYMLFFNDYFEIGSISRTRKILYGKIDSSMHDVYKRIAIYSIYRIVNMIDSDMDENNKIMNLNN